MAVRPEVQRFVDHGPLPGEDDATEEEITARQAELEAITKPVSDEEAIALLPVFGPDDCFGLAWSLLHLVETAPSSPVTSPPDPDANEWVHRLRARAHR